MLSSTGDDNDSVRNVRGGKAALTTPSAKEKRKNFFKKPVNDHDAPQCLWLHDPLCLTCLVSL